MAYVKTVWENLPSENTPINASNLNKIENGIYDNSLKANQVGDLTQLDTTEKSTLVGAINENVDNISKIGKKLWEGSFTSGSITIDGIQDYTFFCYIVGGCRCFGNIQFGSGGVMNYGALTITQYAYRVNPSGNTLTIDSANKGGTNGSTQQPITAIYGLF